MMENWPSPKRNIELHEDNILSGILTPDDYRMKAHKRLKYGRQDYQIVH